MICSKALRAFRGNVPSGSSRRQGRASQHLRTGLATSAELSFTIKKPLFKWWIFKWCARKDLNLRPFDS